MRAALSSIAPHLVDPVDRSSLQLADPTTLLSKSGRSYGFIGGQPLLLPRDGQVHAGWQLPRIAVGDETRAKPVGPGRRLVKRYQRSIRSALGAQGAGAQFAEHLRAGASHGRPLVLVVGGATVGDGCGVVLDAPDIEVAAFDVYPTTATTFVADAHHIPLADGSVDGVWVQAVLEHVADPAAVVREIARILRRGGFVYAETPFLQPVHEGAWDFQRFSPSAHRMLFAGFEELVAGTLGGPASLLSLSLRGVVGGATRSDLAARAVYLLTQPLCVLDRWLSPAWRRDYATGAYFLGRRIDDDVRPFDPAGYYRSLG